jgi:hypothetical protein
VFPLSTLNLDGLSFDLFSVTIFTVSIGGGTAWIVDVAFFLLLAFFLGQFVSLPFGHIWLWLDVGVVGTVLECGVVVHFFGAGPNVGNGFGFGFARGTED